MIIIVHFKHNIKVTLQANSYTCYNVGIYLSEWIGNIFTVVFLKLYQKAKLVISSLSYIKRANFNN